MTTHRRDFLRSAGALGTFAAIGSTTCGDTNATASKDSPFITFDEKWQSYIDSGVYPPRPHLFLDDLFIENMEGLRRVTHSPQKVGTEPVLRAEKPWEGMSLGFRNSVIYDPHDKCFKCWYQCIDVERRKAANTHWGYATSTDGVAWQRPNLGLVEHKGSKENNLVSLGALSGSNALLMNVVRDDRDPNPARRFKAIGLDAHPTQPGEIESPYLSKKSGLSLAGGVFVAYSADGLQWQMRPGFVMGMIVRDGSLLHGYDERTGKWLLWSRASYQRGRRVIGVSESPDFEHWTVPEGSLVQDEHDTPGMVFYELTSTASPDGGYIGMVGVTGWSGKGLNASESMPQLIFARDPRNWIRVSREPFMTRGPDGAFDEGVVMPANPITLGDEIFLFYYAKNRGEIWGDPTRDGKGITTSSIGLAKLPRDRWLSMHGDRAAGYLTTRAIFFASNQLHVNVDARGGNLRTEIQDDLGQPVSGFTLAECDPVSGNHMDQVITWKGKGDLTELIGTALEPHSRNKISRAMRIKFALENARLVFVLVLIPI